jgi:putative peptidoglycan lipid II flippase
VSTPSPQPRLARAATFLAVTTVGSRALGLVREVIIAALFGASAAKAAYVIGYYLPFFVQRLLLGGTLSIVLIPTLADVFARRDETELREVPVQLFTAVLAVGVAMVAAGILAAPLMVPLAAPGFTANAEQLALTIHLTRINFLSMFFLALSVFATAYLQALRRFTAPAVAPLVFNVVTILGTLWLGPRMGIIGLAFAWIAGTAAQFIAQMPALHHAGFRYRVALDWSHPGVRTVRRLAVPAMLGLAIVEINAYVDRLFASLLPMTPTVNAVAALDYAFSVVQAPVGILAISVATVLFPGMSELAAAGQRGALRQTTSLGLRSIIFLMLPVSAGLIVFATPITRLVFQRGQFGPDATVLVAGCTAAFASGLVAMAAYYVITRTYYALHNMRTPVVIGAWMVMLNAALDYLLMRFWGVVGIALSTAIVSCVNVGLLFWLLRQAVGPMDGRRIIATGLRVALATAAAIGAGKAVEAFGFSVLHAARLTGAVVLIAAITAAAAVYLVGCLALRVEELDLVRQLVRRAS